MNVIRRILEYYFIQLCAVDNNVLSTTVLEAVKKKITEDAGGGVPDYTKYHLAQAMLSLTSTGRMHLMMACILWMSIDCDQYRDVFRTIFDVMGHGQHFKE